MGYPMARNLLRAGHQVALWSNTEEKARKLASEEKGKFCETPKQVGESADCIFLCVGTTEMSREVLLGENGVLEGAKPETVVVDASTISPSESRKIGEALKVRGVDFLDAPCTGSTPGAEGGTLTFMIGGERRVFDAVQPYFEPMGKRLYYCGGAGLGLQAKLSQNLILSNLLLAFNEGMVLATKGGIDPKLMLEILDNSAAKSGLISFKAPYVFRGDFKAAFSVKWMFKDIGLMLDSGKELDVPLLLTSLTSQVFQSAVAEGYGEQDICSTIKVLENITGVEVRSQ